MIIIRFPDEDSEHRALGYLAGRFSFKTWATGEMMVPEAALPYMAVERIKFIVEGPATYQHYAPTTLRNPPAPVPKEGITTPV